MVSAPVAGLAAPLPPGVGVGAGLPEVAEEKEAMVQYGSSDSGASLGDILGAALKKNEGESESEDK